MKNGWIEISKNGENEIISIFTLQLIQILMQPFFFVVVIYLKKFFLLEIEFNNFDVQQTWAIFGGIEVSAVILAAKIVKQWHYWHSKCVPCHWILSHLLEMRRLCQQIKQFCINLLQTHSCKTSFQCYILSHSTHFTVEFLLLKVIHIVFCC